MAVGTARYPELDALRGAAALLVVFHHLSTAYRNIAHPHGLAELVARSLAYWGHPAVLLFFVLSGFVLQLNYGQSAPTHYGQYVFRRFMRIFPAMIASLVLAAVLLLPETDEVYGTWLNGIVSGDHSLASWFRNAALVAITPDDITFNPVLWSLAYEWRVSLIFPLLAVVALRHPRAVAVTALPLYIASKLALLQLGMHAPYLDGVSALGAVLVTLFYLPAFFMGMVLAVWVLRHGRPAFKIPLWLEAAWLAGVVMPYFFVKEDFALALGATALVSLLVCGGRIGRLFRFSPMLWLGKVSYSLYLVHFPLMLFFLAFYPALPLLAALALTLATSLALAEVSYRCFEKPGVNLGKQIGSLIQRRAIFRRG